MRIYSYQSIVPSFYVFLHLYPDLTIVLNHSLLMLFPIKVFSSGLWRTVFKENSAILAVKLLTHQEKCRYIINERIN